MAQLTTVNILLLIALCQQICADTNIDFYEPVKNDNSGDDENSQQNESEIVKLQTKLDNLEDVNKRLLIENNLLKKQLEELLQNNNDIADELWLKLIPNMVSPELCAKIIDVAENEVGFAMGTDSIDDGLKKYDPIQQIDVFDKHKNMSVPELYPLIQPILSKLKEIVNQRKQETWSNHKLTNITQYTPHTMNISELGWIFLRKYSPNSPRNTLKLHLDTNIFTISLALNGVDDYDGGGVFFVKPDSDWVYSDNEYIPPRPPKTMLTYRYLQNVKRLNTSHRIFPEMNTGDVLIYNYSVWHGIAPLISGTRYSMGFFYDTEYEHKYKKPQNENDAQNEVLVEFVNLIDDDDVTIDLYWIVLDKKQKELDQVIVQQDMKLKSKVRRLTYEHHIFRAIDRERGGVIIEFIIRAGTSLYEIKLDHPIGAQKDEL